MVEVVVVLDVQGASVIVKLKSVARRCTAAAVDVVAAAAASAQSSPQAKAVAAAARPARVRVSRSLACFGSRRRR